MPCHASAHPLVLQFVGIRGTDAYRLIHNKHTEPTDT